MGAAGEETGVRYPPKSPVAAGQASVQPKGSAGLWVGLSMYLLILSHRLFQMNPAINQLKEVVAVKKAEQFP